MRQKRTIDTEHKRKVNEERGWVECRAFGFAHKIYQPV